MSRTFQLSAGHPVLDFVNTLDNRFSDDGPLELLATYDDLCDFVLQSGLATGRVVRAAGTRGSSGAADALRSAHELREALAVWCYAGDDGGAGRLRALGTLERYFLHAYRHRKLAVQCAPRGSKHSLRLHWTWGRRDGHALLPVWLIAQAAASLLNSEDTGRIHQCGNDACRWLFIDMSRNHSRRWCDMKLCGNRMKARRFQRRVKPESSPTGPPAPSTG